LPQRGSRSLFVDGLLSWNPAKERGPTFPSWGGEYPLSLSRGKYGGLVHLVITEENSASLLSIWGSTKTLYILTLPRGFYLSRKKAGPLKNIGGWLSLFLGGRKLSLSIPLSFFPLCLFFLLFPL
jgi:hypothetical protein